MIDLDVIFKLVLKLYVIERGAEMQSMKIDNDYKIRLHTYSSSENEPDSLFEQCTKYVIQHLQTLAVDDKCKGYCLREGLTLPSEICERLFEAYQQAGGNIDDEFVNIFKNPAATRLRRIRLKNSSITDDGLSILLNHNLLELDLSYCSSLTQDSLNSLNEKADNLVSLSIGSQAWILPHFFSKPEIKRKNGKYFFNKMRYILRAPNLRKLSIHVHNVYETKVFFKLLLKPLTKLTHLDLSHCSSLDDPSCLTDLQCLTSLILFNVKSLFPSALGSIIKLKTLRHLDVSQLSSKNGTYANPNQTLAILVENLPNLVSLDISGTNLAGTGVAEHSLVKSDGGLLTDIPGLRSRVGNPFEFLGLYETHYQACKRHDIPAKCISGEANERQILNAMVAYMDRPEILQKVVVNIFQLFQHETCNNIYVAVKLILEAMDRHLLEKEIQISGSASLYYMAQMKGKKPSFEVKMKHHIISTIVNGMITYKDDETMMRNGCFTLCQFNIPEDVMFDYDRLVYIILHILSEVHQDVGLLQRTAIYLLNSLACQAERSQKLLLGELGAVSKMLAIISDRLDNGSFDDVLQVAWSAMWNVTDETPINCQKFLDANGMELFLSCLAMCDGRDELLRSMMGLLGNVAEVKSLRPRLMLERYVTIFADLLDCLSDGIEVSYNAAGILAHMCSDGPEAWTVVAPERDMVLTKMVAAIEMWDLSVERIINYRSFHPILGLLKVRHTLECQHWAVWALANLTKVYPNKYCSLVEDDGGIPLLEEVIQSETSYHRIKELAFMVLNNCRNHKMKKKKC